MIPKAHGRRKLSRSGTHPNIENWIESTESRIEFEWNIFPGLKSLDIFQRICKIKRLIQNILVESSSCQCSKTLDEGRKIRNMHFEFRTSQELCEKFPAWTLVDEDKWYGTHTYKPEGKRNSIAEEMVEQFKETGPTVFRGSSALNRGAPKRKGGRCTIHFTAESLNTELLFRTKPQEVNSLVQTPTSDNRASGNRLRECLHRFETLENRFNLRESVCEDATFARRVSIEMSDKTILDVDDGFGDRAENTHFLVKIKISRIYATIPGQTIIGPLLQAIFRYLGINKTEIRIPSTTTKYLNLLVGGMPRDKPFRGRVTSQ